MNLIKKIFFGILVASSLFAIAYFLPNIYNVGFDPTKIYGNYTTYIFVLYISIVLIYLCATTHSRLSTMAMITLLLVNFFRLTSFFTQDILGISMSEFYALTILFVLALAITRIRYRVRFPFIVLIGIPFIIILFNHALPLYPDKPDFEGFYNSQKITLNTQTSDDAQTLQEAETKITVTSNNTEKILSRNKPSDQIELGTSETQILFSSKTGIQNTFAYIIFPRGVIVELYPQSAIEISQSATINIIQGQVNVYTPGDQTGYHTLTGDLTKIILDDTGNVQTIIDGFTADRNAYFINQIGGEIMLNPTIDAFIGRYLNIANSASKIIQNLSNYFSINLSISSFDQNIFNYNEFHKYLQYQKNQSYTAPTGSTERIARDTEKGWNATNSKARRDNIKNFINNIFK